MTYFFKVHYEDHPYTFVVLYILKYKLKKQWTKHGEYIKWYVRISETWELQQTLSQCCLKSRFGTKQIVDEVYNIYIYIYIYILYYVFIYSYMYVYTSIINTHFFKKMPSFYPNQLLPM